MVQELEKNELQEQGIELCCDIKKRLTAVTGPAGVGKTRILKEVYDRLVSHGYRVALAAPTGKAAKRISESTGIPAQTHHRLLQYTHPGEVNPKTGKPYGVSYPRRDRMNPLEYDVLLSDEHMMVNQAMHRNLIDALPKGGALRCYGDKYQLAPIEENKRLNDQPAAFEDVLRLFPHVELTKSYRTAEGSGILENANAIKAGRMPKRLADFVLRITETPIQVVEELVYNALEAGIDYRTPAHQIIVPTVKGWCGTVALNSMIQNMFLDEQNFVMDLPRHDWAEGPTTLRVQVGSKVIYTKNIYALEPGDLEIFNGETGVVTSLNEYGEVTIDLGDRIVCIPPEISYVTPEGKYKAFDPRKDIDLAYVITTHKSQGSEYAHVTYIVNRSRAFNLNRRNTYTAATRARKHVNMIADQRGLSYALRAA